MRFTGTLRSWHDDRGFGFIAPTQGGREIFVHISEFPRDGSRPTLGEKLIYELGKGRDGKPQAIHVAREALALAGSRRPPARPGNESSRSWPRRATVLLVVIGLGGYAYTRYPRPPAPRALMQPQGPDRRQVAGTQPPAEARFQCDGRTHCSQMTSCTEAKFFLKNCPGTAMDGDHDGVPCERQWCTSPFAK